MQRDEAGSVAPCAFGAPFRERLRQLFVWRRDVRRFRRDALPEGTLERLIDLAALAPSVGLSQPSRFVVVKDAARRAAIRTCYSDCNKEALAAQRPEKADLYARLKLAGLNEAPGHLAVFADPETRQGDGLGRRTMPETIDYSVVLAIHTMWLAARAEGLGLGWVSILDPARVCEILEVPAGWHFIGYLCIGYPQAEDNTPELEREGWERRRSASKLLFYR
ncbi:5,6-dimethylbenzimidazole synthase [Methyloligella sp. 2.7D]|uniref:5,6-dimethylbenzimidazole synthase n=1 Tax=unclassified Methyloligella TaxID=2625955 RepID=UPI00157D2DA5|nr:5,6-dimethylbenzimidazole synthase [Methyloligella sp. GL2]QKP77046.1 5,6-dimethylbenzimidazole synthase [Methyloligella sp. GL2]